ncbi:ATP-NAD kinase family protein [soil metagenome]
MLGLVVNPVAGLGGPAGLAGSDGAAVQQRARERGAVPRAGDRAREALEVVARAHPGARIVVAADEMGEFAARAAGLEVEVVVHSTAPTTAGDTKAAVAALADAGATLVLFAGGDGTARDVASALPAGVAALGIPAGVKMYSPVFAVSPRAAGATAAAWLTHRLPLMSREVLDVDEDALRLSRVAPQLFGMMDVPYQHGRTQARKTAMPSDDHSAVVAAARGVVAAMQPGVRYLLGPGGTMAEVAALLQVEKTPLGVDVVLDGTLELRGASESELVDVVGRGPAKAVVSIIGGQGFLLGRGNQQFSPRVVRALGADPLVVVSPQQKLTELNGAPLLVDTGDPALDARIAGFVRVITGPSTTSIYPVRAPETEGESHAT